MQEASGPSSAFSYYEWRFASSSQGASFVTHFKDCYSRDGGEFEAGCAESVLKHYTHSTCQFVKARDGGAGSLHHQHQQTQEQPQEGGHSDGGERDTPSDGGDSGKTDPDSGGQQEPQAAGDAKASERAQGEGAEDDAGDSGDDHPEEASPSKMAAMRQAGTGLKGDEEPQRQGSQPKSAEELWEEYKAQREAGAASSAGGGSGGDGSGPRWWQRGLLAGRRRAWSRHWPL